MVDEQAFREALSRFPSGVTILTLYGRDGSLRGITVSAFSSLSLRPALVLACISRKAACHAEMTRGIPFGISILTEDQADIALRFATPIEDKFNGVEYRFGPSGVPLIEGACVQLECCVANLHIGGDHTIVVGNVTYTQIAEGLPLVYAQRNFHRLPSYTAPMKVG